jgi:hypothetical protein
MAELIRKPVESLTADAVLCQPVDFDWSEGYGETWETIPPDVSGWTYAECRHWLNYNGRGCPAPDPADMDRAALAEALAGAGIEVRDDETDDVLRAAVIANIDDGTIDGIEDWRDAVSEGMQDSDGLTPMMNYYYPLPHYGGDAGEDQAMLDQHAGAVCLAEVEGVGTVLALTGGGMDLSWDICHAHMLLGYLPPLHFCDLPAMGGMTLTDRNRWILDGCEKSAEVAASWANQTRERVRGLRERMAQKGGGE